MAKTKQQRSLPGLDGDELSLVPDVPNVPSAVVRGSPDPVRQESVNIQGWNVYVVDAHSLIFQVFHAIPEMSSPRGEQVGAVYGFVRDMLYLIEEKQPDALICAFDLPGPTFRNEMYDGYKAERRETPEELIGQVPKIEQVLEAMGVPVLSYTGFEADDILATLARICDEAGANCFIVSGDKDCRQLITDRVAVYNIRKDQLFDAAKLREEWGVGPDQVVDFQALVGDAVDNVPGVPTIGPKTATSLLEKYGTLDSVLEHATEIPGAKGKKIAESKELALLSRELVRLDTQVPIVPDWDASRIGGMNPQRLTELFADFGFRSLAERVAKLTVAGGAAAASTGADPTATTTSANYQLIDTPEKLADLVAKLSQQTLISVDTETTHVWPRWAEIVGYSFAYQPGEAFYVPVRGPVGDPVLDPQQTLETLRPMLENPAIGKLGQNLKYDAITIRGAGARLAGMTFDTMVASYLLDAGGRSYSLDDLAKRFLNHTTIKIGELIGKGREQKRMDEVPVAQVCTYAAEDADIPLQLQPLLIERLAEMDLEELNATLEVPLIDVLVDMEFTGVRVDPVRLAELSVRYGKRLAELEGEI